MKTSHVIIGLGAVSILGYLIWKKQSEVDSSVIPGEEVQPQAPPVVTTTPVATQQPQPPVFIPIVKEPGEPKPDKIITVTTQPVSKPVYVAPVDNPSPVYVTPTQPYNKLKITNPVSGFNMY